jgi:hypothetical protein
LFWCAAASAGPPPEGVALQVRRGFFTETDIGVFFTVGGNNKYSNAQTYLQLGIGYDLTEHIELGAYFGLGTSAANCFAGIQSGGACALTDSFTMAFFNLSAAYLVTLAKRFYLTPRVTGGYIKFDPAPAFSNNRVVTSAPNVGGGIGVEYATNMDHFSIGLDVLARVTLGPSITSLAVFPRIKYTF